MQKTLLYLAILAILGFGVWYFLFSNKSGQMFRSADAGFTIRDTAAIGKIFLAANENPNTITIERKGGSWIVNNKYPVLRSTLDQLLATLYNQRAAYPVPDNQRDGIIRNLAGAAIKTEIYDLEGRRMRTFYVGGELNRFSGTVMLMEGSEQPYVVQIPGFEGYPDDPLCCRSGRMARPPRIRYSGAADRTDKRSLCPGAAQLFYPDAERREGICSARYNPALRQAR